MRKFLRATATLLLALLVCVVFSACGDGGSTTTTTTATTTTTTTNSTTAPPPKEYTASEVVQILNQSFGILTEAMADGEDGTDFGELTDISIDNVINNGTDGLGFEKLYTKDDFTYSVSDGKITIEKEKNGYVAIIGSDSQTIEKLDDSSDFVDLSGIFFRESDLEVNENKKNSFFIEGSIIVDLLNMAEDEELYDSSVLQDVEATLSMTYFEEDGSILISIKNDFYMFAAISVTTDYKDGKGTVTLNTSTDYIEQELSYTAGDAGAKKLEYVATIPIGEDDMIMSIIMESKGDDYEVAEGTDHKSCDGEIYEMSIKKNSETLMTVKLNAARIGSNLRGYIDVYMGEGAPDTGMGGIGLISSSAKLQMKGTFDMAVDGEEIVSATANLEMEYALISGDVSINYNEQYMKEAGKAPLTATVRDNALTTYITLETVSYSSGQGNYKLTVEESDGSLTADVSIPAVKNYELTEREQTYLARADKYLNNVEKVENDVRLLETGAQKYAESTLTKYAYIVSRSFDGERVYLTNFYAEDGEVYYDIYINLNFELIEYIYTINNGSLSSYLNGSMALSDDMTKAYAICENALDGYSVTNHEPYVIELYKEELGLYIYLDSENSGSYALSFTPLGAEELEGVPHRVDLEGENITLEDIHDLERKVDQNCSVYYTCKDCLSVFSKGEKAHTYSTSVTGELTADTAESKVLSCSTCGEMHLEFTDSKSNTVIMPLTAIIHADYSFYGVTGDMESMVTVKGKIEYLGENGEFDRAISIPDIYAATGKKIVGIEGYTYSYSLDFCADVILPEGVVFIEPYAFPFDVSSLSLPSTLRYVERSIITVNSSMTELTIPEGVVVFKYQHELSELESLTVNATNMTEFHVPQMKTYNITFTGMESIERMYYTSYLQIQHVNVPNGVKGLYGLKGNVYVRSISLPASVTYLESYAFSECHSLEEAIIPDSLTGMGWKMFYECTNLKTVKVILEDGTVVGNENEVRIPSNIYEVCGFDSCTSITRVIIPDGVTRIGGLAFLGCTSLEYVRVPDSIEIIGQNAFNGCTALGDEGFSFGPNLREIGNLAFNKTNIKNVTISYNGEEAASIRYESFGGMKLDTLTVDSEAVLLLDVAYESHLGGLELKTLNVIKCPKSGTTLGIRGTETVNISYKELAPTVDGENAKYYVHADVKTLNFSGTKEEFEALRIHFHGEETVVNYNVDLG